jgi:HupE / UreJ protein
MKSLGLLVWATLLGLLCFSSSAAAHKASDSYLFIEQKTGGASGRWDIALRDLNDAIGLDRDSDGQVTWGEVQSAEPRIEAYARASLLATSPTGRCDLSFGRMAVVAHSDGTYAALDVTFACPGDARALRLHYDLLFAIDAQHRGVIRTSAAAPPIVVTKSRREAELTLQPAGGFAAFWAMLRIGTEHILHGYDHLLFLTALLLPSALRRESGRWVAVAAFPAALRDVLRVVTAFTVAHSLTLGLSAAHLVSLPSRFVESAIAFSVVLAALNNLFPLVRSERWLAAFCLGLLHGFGFAATLTDIDLSPASFARTLFGFNLGVEIGQLGVVLLLLPLIYGFRRSLRYQRIGLPLGSAAVFLVACVWLVERAFNLRIIS